MFLEAFLGDVTPPEKTGFGLGELGRSNAWGGFGKMAEMGFGEACGRRTTYGAILTSYTPLGRTGVAVHVDWCVAAGGLGGMPYLYLAIRRKTNIVRR